MDIYWSAIFVYVTHRTQHRIVSSEIWGPAMDYKQCFFTLSKWQYPKMQFSTSLHI